MSRSLNKIQLIGNIGQDPELRKTQQDTSVTSFSMATTETWKDRDGERQESTEWHNIVCWDKLAEIAAEYLFKGSRIYIEGRSKTRKYDDKEGITRYMTEVIAQSMIMLDSKPKASGDPV